MRRHTLKGEMPKTSPLQTPVRMAAFEDACETSRTLAEAGSRTGVSVPVRKSWGNRDPRWLERCKDKCRRHRASLAGPKGRKRSASQRIRAGVPLSFLEFRERFFKHSTFFFHRDAFDHISRHDRLIMVCPPEHGKTTVWAIEYAVWRLMLNPDLRIVVIQKSGEEAKKILAAVKARLTDHEFYQALGVPIEEDPITLYAPPGGFKPEREDGLTWGAESFYLRGRSLAEKDPSMQAKGATSAILGNRIDLLIADDIQDDRNYSPQGLDALKRWWQHSVMSRMGDVTRKDSKIIVLGSRIGPGDVYEWLMEAYGLEEGGDYPEAEIPLRWPIVRYPAILNEETRELLAPDLWTWEGLMDVKFRVRESWATNWLGIEGAAAEAAFTRETMRAALDHEWSFGDMPREVDEVAIGVDPAVARVGWCALLALGVNRKTGHRYVLDIYRAQDMRHWPAVIAKIAKMCDRLTAAGRTPRVLCIESRNVQDSLANDPRLREEMASRHIRITSYTTATATGARAEETDFSISTLASQYEASLISLPYGDPETRGKIDAFLDECVNWRPKPAGRTSWHLVRDQVMAHLFAEAEIRKLASRSARRPARRPIIPVWVAERSRASRRGLERLAIERDDARHSAEQRAQRRGHTRKTLSDAEVAELRAANRGEPEDG